MHRLQNEIERLYAAGALTGEATAQARAVFLEFRDALTRGEVRAAEKTTGSWQVNAWVKQGILLGFRIGEFADMSGNSPLSFIDKDTFPVRRFKIEDKIRVVPGGSSIRSGAYVAPGAICMPPMFVNAGAYVDEATMIDSHALVGSCAQIGQRVHVSAAAQIGGVLEPVGALPVVIEDDVLVGGNCGVYEGAVVKRRAVLASGTILTGSTPLYDLPNGRIIEPSGGPLIVPEGAVVVPGTRPVTGVLRSTRRTPPISSGPIATSARSASTSLPRAAGPC